MPGSSQPGWQPHPSGRSDRDRRAGSEARPGPVYGGGRAGGEYGRAVEGWDGPAEERGSGRTGRPRPGSARTGSGRTGADRAGNGRAGNGRAAAARTGSARTGAARSGPARPGGPRQANERPGQRQGSDRPGQRPDRQRAGGRDREPTPGAAGAGSSSQRPRRRTPIWAKLTLALGAVLMLLSGTALAGYEIINDRYTSNVQTENLLGESAVEPGQELEGPINLLMLGLDEQGEGARSDSIIVLHIPSTHDQAYLMSVPRDTWVTVPGYYDMKITDAFNLGYENEGGWSGGAQIIASVLNDLTGLRFNGAAIVNFSGFEKIIDEMGGLEFCVDTPAYSEHLILVDGEPVGVGRARREGLYGEEVRYEVGCREMEGWEALDYARQRKTLASEEGDYGRQRHQVQLLRAMAAKATSPDVTANLSTLDSLILAAGDAIIVDTNDVPLIDFLFTLRGLRPNDLVTLQTNQGNFQSEQINGVSVERLTPESVQMFQAAANDSMGQFLVSNPDFLAPEGPPDTADAPQG